ncbi:recombination mediator RecR [bacterium]|jgi:recombination protein RecR|nr:recombination protein RecR [Gemmatimonadota bacterium]MCH2663915.1 recombination mediator RecR [bacterium]HCK12240.1 recombination protein RecR [Candidatus Latescibacterota bacterium]
MADDPIDRLAKGLGRFPGVGPKSARRIALDLLTWSTDEVRQLADLLVEIKTNVLECSTCFNLAVEDPCRICSDMRRDGSTIMVVDAVANLIAVERTNSYRGVYHVLGGRLSPLDGIGPEDLKIAELEARIASGKAREVILANEPTVEGDATAQYISQALSNSGVQITQIARGLPVGSDLSLADQVTLSRALEGRREL